MNKLTREEHLLIRLGEECNEVAQRVSKSILFTLDEVQPGQDLDNRQRLSDEMNDLIGVFVMLGNEGYLPELDENAVKRKAEKVEKYIKYSDDIREKAERLAEEIKNYEKNSI